MTTHCRAATASQLIRGYQGDYRRQSLTSVATREPPLDKSFHISLGDQGSAVRVRAPRALVKNGGNYDCEQLARPPRQTQRAQIPPTPSVNAVLDLDRGPWQAGGVAADEIVHACRQR